jgi:hypothetical protein
VADRETVRAEIETAPGPISVWEFSHFLYLFRATYAAAVDYMAQSGQIAFGVAGDESEGLAVALREVLRGYDSRQIVHLASKDLPGDLTILHVTRRNPVSIEFGGIPIALAVAVVLSGGSFKLGPLSVRLPPLGTGIAALREAFGGKPKRRGTKKRPRS